MATRHLAVAGPHVPSSIDSDQHSTTTADTVETWDSASSTSTVWGPGTLSGKAIKSLGEASLRGVEKLIIRWKLARINATLPQAHRNIDATSLAKSYDDLLELSRLDFYTPNIRQKALRLIMIQIGSRETKQLVACIVKWPLEEIRIFLSEMISWMPLLWESISFEENQHLRPLELIGVFRSSQSGSESHEVIPFLDFVRLLSEENHTASRAVLKAGFLDFLVRIHANFTFDSAPTVIYACDLVLTVLTSHLPLELKTISVHHRMNIVWPRLQTHMFPLSRRSKHLTRYTAKMRRATWKVAEKHLIFQRLCEIEVVVMSYEDQHSREDLFDVCLDLMALSSNHHQRDISKPAFSLLLECIARGGDFWVALMDAIGNLASDIEIVDIFYRIVYPLSRLKIEVLPTAANFYESVRNHHPNASAADHFMGFALSFVDRNPGRARALIDAEIIVLLGSTPNFTSTLLNRLQRALSESTSSRAEKEGTTNKH